MIGPSVGVDHQVGNQVLGGRLDQNVNPLGRTRAADRIADDPAHGIARRHRPGTGELLAFLQGDVGHLARRGINLIEGAVRPRILLDGVDEPARFGLHTRRRVGRRDASGRITPFGRCADVVRDRLHLTGQRQGRRDGDDLHGLGRFWRERRRRGHSIVKADGRRLVRRGAAGDRKTGDQQSRKAGFAERRMAHEPNSFDQLIAVTKTPSGFFRSASGVDGSCRTMVRIADQRSVAASAPSS